MMDKKSKIKSIFGNKYIIIIGTILILSIIAISVFLLIKGNDRNVDDIEISNLTYVSPLKESDEAKAAKLIKENIVKITNKVNDQKSIIGTGFFIQEGYLITNSHIVDVMGDVTIEYYDGSTSQAHLYANSIENDIAVLKVENVPIKSLVFGSSNELEVTNNVLAAGFIYNFAGEATVSKGILSARRNHNNFVYLQSDLAIDTGSSGGPLFNAKAEVIGINTYVTENRTFSLTISSESASMIIDTLIKYPTIEYLTDKRPSNSINKILVEVGYTTDEKLDLYNDYKLIIENKKDKKEELKEVSKKENVSTSNSKQETYYCDEIGYSLIGKTCVKTVSYDASLKEQYCKDGYTKKGEQCIKTYVVDAKVIYPCDNGRLTEDNKCAVETIQTRGFNTYNDRWGSCPSGKECYDLGTNHHTNTAYNKFVTTMVCPNNDILINSEAKIIWSNEEYIDSNFKTWRSSTPGAVMKKDSDGLTYFEDTSNILALCAKDYDKKNGVYTVYTYDELKDIACPNGGTLTANTNNQGFYCLYSTSIKRYAWDVTCLDTSDSVILENDGGIYCGQYIEVLYDVAPYYECEKGEVRGDVTKCHVEETYNLPIEYYCASGGILEGLSCRKTEAKPALKKIN